MVSDKVKIDIKEEFRPSGSSTSTLIASDLLASTPLLEIPDTSESYSVVWQPELAKSSIPDILFAILALVLLQILNDYYPILALGLIKATSFYATVLHASAVAMDPIFDENHKVKYAVDGSLSCLTTALLIRGLRPFLVHKALWSVTLIASALVILRAIVVKERAIHLKFGGTLPIFIVAGISFASPHLGIIAESSLCFFSIILILPGLILRTILSWKLGRIVSFQTVVEVTASVIMLVVASLDLILPGHLHFKDRYKWAILLACIGVSQLELGLIFKVCLGLLLEYKKQAFQALLLVLETTSYVLAEKAEDKKGFFIAILVLSVIGFSFTIIHPIIACRNGRSLRVGSHIELMDFSLALIQLVAAIPPVAGLKLPFDLMGFLPIIFALIGLWFSFKKNINVDSARCVHPLCICQAGLETGQLPRAHQE